jgi:hemerythrin-like domain-containing protein
MKPTDVLRNEHRSIERLLSVLETAINRTESGERIPAKLFHDAIHFIRMFADGCHHRKEETLLFPAMEQKGIPREGGPIGVMLEEHDAGRAHVHAMQIALQRYGTDEAAAMSDLVLHVRAFVVLLREHIMKEDNVLFVMADQHLSEPDQTRLSEEFLGAETSNEACTLKSDLLVLLERLEQQVTYDTTT